MQPIRLFVAGIAGVALAGCSGLFQKDEPQRSAAGQPQQEQAAPQPSQQASAAEERATAKEQTPVAVARPVSHQLVRKVQEELKAEGIDPGPIDGRWGPRTSQAVRKFQQSEGIETTAQLDEPTLAALGIGGRQTASTDAPSASAGGTQGAEAAAARAGVAAQREGEAVKLQRSELGRRDGESNDPPRFANLDANDDGMLTLAEAAADTRVSRNFERADGDNDHRLNREEFQAALEVDRQGAQSPFVAADRNNDGTLSREEYQEALRTLQARAAKSAGAGGSAASK